jgi:tRNA-dihydrouridine synthase B
MVLAPLAGYTDLPFRSVVKEFGVDLTISEMISSNALVYNSQKTLKMIQKSSNESPYFVQLSGNNPNIIKEAVLILNDIDGIDGIDLNCGCPAPKVFSHGSGSALLNDLPKMQKILETIKEYSTKRYTTAKIRVGVDEKIPLEIAKTLSKTDIDMVSVHGRTKKGAYKAPVDYDAIKIIKDNISIPVIANGDIKDKKTADYVIDYVKADGIMIGRGAIGKPWIFYQIKHNLDDISSNLKKDIILKHFDNMVQFYGEYGAIMFRKHLHTYSKGYPKSSDFRQLINNEKDTAKIRDMIKDFFDV